MRLLPAAFAACLLVSPLLASASPATPGEADARMPFVERRPLAESLKRARTEKKAVMVDVFATWCGPCKIMDASTFSDAETTAWARTRFVPVRFDAERGEGRKVAARYAVSSFPTVLFLDGDGNELDRLLGAHGPKAFRDYGDQILAGKSGVQKAIAELNAGFSVEQALPVVQALMQRKDLRRIKPIAMRVLEADPEISSQQSLEVLVLFAALLDERKTLPAEVADQIASVLPRLQADQRAYLAAVLSHEYARRGDAKSARDLVDGTLKAVGDSTPYAQELWATLGDAEKKKGNADASVAAYRKALALLEKANAPAPFRALRQLDLGDALAAAGKAEEAKKAAVAALGLVTADAAAFSRAARVASAAKYPEDALAWARRAVELSNGEDADAQAALAVALGAKGDAAGASAAWKKAAEIDPENVEYRRNAGGPGAAKKKPSAT